MRLDLTEMLYALSFALDNIENEMGGITTGHGKNVAYLSLLMAKETSMTEDELRDFVGCAILHDNAFTEYIREEYGDLARSGKVRLSDSKASLDKYLHGYEHSLMGEKNIKLLPFKTNIRHVLLHHHENANGTGPFKKKWKHTNLKSQIIHLADIIDVNWDIANMSEDLFNEMVKKVCESEGKAFSKDSIDLFKKAISYNTILDIKKNTALGCLKRDLKTVSYDYTDDEIKNIALFFAKIVDYKSSYTKNHSIGVANKCEIMAKYYNFDKEKTIRFYLAGALHDIGKLCVVNDVLEKNDKLTASEYDEIKEHAAETHNILCQINDIKDICRWASNHHERLDGSGYPQGLTEDELSFEDKLLAEIDIYQALIEKRPYKSNLSHFEAIDIMKKMSNDGKIDQNILYDINKVLGGR